jgi:hypothetical protein
MIEVVGEKLTLPQLHRIESESTLPKRPNLRKLTTEALDAPDNENFQTRQILPHR